MKPSRVVIKMGGASLQDKSIMKTLTQALREYRHYGYQVILVHGGGPAINNELSRRQIPWSFYQGQQITTPKMMSVIENVLFKKVNHQLVKHLSQNSIAAVGLSGAQNNLLVCSQASERLGLVGDITTIDTSIIEKVLASPGSPVPVIATVGIGAQGEKYNINADWAASRLAAALQAVYLIFLTDQNGILNEGHDLIPELSSSGLHTLIEDEVVRGGMLTKAKTILDALQNGVKAVRIMNGKDCVKGLWSNQVGTWCIDQTEADSIYKEEIAAGLRELRYAFS